MNYGIVMYAGIDPRVLAEVARECEEAGWDGFFIWDAFLSDNAWVILAAAAMVTKRIRLGTMVTAPSRRRPWQLASEVATLDRLSNGRAILPLALGAAEDLGFAKVGEETEQKVRAELLDESIDILSGLWSGKPFDYQGKHYRIEDVTFTPTPVQSPRVPLWVVGAWPRMKSMHRVLRCDGLIPAKMTANGASPEVTPDELWAMKSFVEAQRTLNTPFDIILEGDTPGDDRRKAAALIHPYIEAGITWWLESAAVHHRRGGLEGARRRIAQGPPRA